MYLNCNVATLKQVHDILRDRLLRSIGQKPSEPWFQKYLPKKVVVTLADIDANVKKKWCPKFFKLMKNRLAMGFLRYEVNNPIRESGKRHDYVEAIQIKLNLYKESGNTELMVDIGNYAMLEFKDPTHPDAHFFAGDAADDSHHAPVKK